ncbi:MAG TPA: thioredoxin family protein [Coriobacteriia bacterium]
MSDMGTPGNGKRQAGWILAALIVFAFAAIIVAKQGSNAAAESSAATSATQSSVAATTVGGPSSSHADANAAYEKALASGKPIYLLFHSLTCVPCIEISAVVDKVIPEYGGRVVFVNAISDDEPSQRLAEKFKFQYIPTSFFIDSKGTVIDSFTGAMDEPAMRVYLDKLAAE